MNNKKCPYCGFINFVDAEVCRKCETNLMAEEESYQTSDNERPVYRGGVNSYRQPYQAKSAWTLGKVVACIAGLLFGGVFYTVAVRPIVWGRGGVDWIEYHPDSLPVTVMMPNVPTREEPVLTPLPSGRVSLHAFTSVVPGQGVAGFAYAEFFGVDLSDTSQALDNGLNGLLTKSNSTLVSKTKINDDGMPGLEFEVTPPESAGIKNARGYGKLFISGDRLYLLFITASENTDLLAGKDKFLNAKFEPRPTLPVYKIPPLNIPSPVRRVWPN